MEKYQPISTLHTLEPDSKAMRQAFALAAKQANRMANAFGLKAPSAEMTAKTVASK